MCESYEIAVIGAGAMGHGIAVQCAVTGQDVTLIDHRQRNLDQAKDSIRQAVAFLNEHEVITLEPEAVLSRISITLETSVGVDSADVVLETITEDLESKQGLFAEVAQAAPGDAVLASNTSSIPITKIAEGISDHAARTAGCHWWYPPYLLEPVEVIRGEETVDRTIDRLRSFVRAVDRDPILVERDVPGFVWNRIQFAVIRECLHLVDQGVASVEDVNSAVRDGYATRTAAIGPFETMDIAGLELFETIAEDLYPELATDDVPQAELNTHIREGRTGIDVGAGFFEYDISADEVTHLRDERLAAIRQALEDNPPL